MAELKQVDLELTPEMQKQLDDLCPIEPDDTFKYVPIAYRGKNKKGDYYIPKKSWPIFDLNSPDAFELAEIEDNSGEVVQSTSKGKTEMIFRGKSGITRITILKHGVKSWRNYKNKKGKIVEYKNKQSVSVLPVALQTELQNAINERKTLIEEELRGLE